MTATHLQADTIGYVCNLVRDRSAIVIEPEKSYLIESRLSPVARRHGFASTAELIRAIRDRRQADLQRQVVEAMTTNETSFFRDLHPFESLRTSILPDLTQRRRTQQRLAIWSAACSTGQEIYSIAMLLREHFPHLANWNITLRGTDISEEVLTKAREGKYTQIEVNRGLSAHLLTKYFVREGAHWRLSPAIRGMAEFSQLNLNEAWSGLPQFDDILLRNVLIYFSP
ncbi:MAG: protein-glutamate O-methyltransferase CheR, partial [Pirellulaceae bacterium]